MAARYIDLCPARVGVGGAARERFPLQRARGFTERGAQTGNVNAKPRRIQRRLGRLRRPCVQKLERHQRVRRDPGVRWVRDMDLLLIRRREGAEEGGDRPRLYRPSELDAVPPRVQRHRRKAGARHQ